MTVRETTTPALADEGRRSFVVKFDEFTEIEVVATLRLDDSLFGEPVKLIQADHVATNHDLTTVFIQLASRTVALVGNQLPS